MSRNTHPPFATLRSPSRGKVEMERTAERPSVMEKEIFCEGCGERDTAFVTNREVWKGIVIEKPCRRCGRFTKWRLRRGEF